MSQNAEKIGASSLLQGFLELRRLVPDMEKWSVEKLSDNPPRFYRLRTLTSLFCAFGIDWDPSSFIEGKFIDPESPRYAPLLQKVHGLRLREKKHRLSDCFRILLEYRERVDGVLTFSSGLLEASGWYLFAHQKAEELNRVIQDNVAIIDDMLIAFISPEAKTFTEDELTRNYGYPDVDLFEIDSDWW